jgi:3-hydroxyisobutyrate dehydrogenase-like beta-hydroxyacid dehydrogenase
MADTTIGLLHPGEMGAALGSVLRGRDNVVLWASSGRSAATARRGEQAGLRDVGTVTELADRSNVIVSVCPPHAALEVAQLVAGFDGVFVDVNAVSPATAQTVAGAIEAGGGLYVDGGIVGVPPRSAGTTHLYLSGASAPTVAALFTGTVVDARVVSDRLGAASALKMAYAAWTKGTAALLLAIRALARAEAVEEALLEEWRESIPDLPEQSLRAASSACGKGWRWIAEMEEIASTFGSVGLPNGFHHAAAEIYRKAPRLDGAQADEPTLDQVLLSIAQPGA